MNNDNLLKCINKVLDKIENMSDKEIYDLYKKSKNGPIGSFLKKAIELKKSNENEK